MLEDYMAEKEKPNKISTIPRDAYIYLEPEEGAYKPDVFAQCESCMMFVPAKKRCMIHAKDKEITETMSCGFYLNGKPGSHTTVTPEESGLVDRKVRCENCSHADTVRKKCKLFTVLNNNFPWVFQLKVDINPKGCCNAQTSKGEK